MLEVFELEGWIFSIKAILQIPFTVNLLKQTPIKIQHW